MEDQEALQKQIEETFERVIQKIDGGYMRRVQADAHRCALNCYERPNGSYRGDGECASQCQRSSSRAGAVFNNCLEEYHSTLTTCMQSCLDSVRYSKDLSPENKKRVMDCSKKCVSSFVSKQGSVVEKCLDMLKKQG